MAGCYERDTQERKEAPRLMGDASVWSPLGSPTISVGVPPSVVADVAIGTTIGRFRVLEQIGAGGMGRVFRAHDPQLDRFVALKVLHRQSDERARRRMTREAQAMAALSHPNIVPVFDIGGVTLGGPRRVVFIAMELVEGRTLNQWLAAQVRGREAILAVFDGAGAGLAAAHEAGLVHRDFKPSNVLIDRSGRPRVLDFGLARAMDSTASDSIPAASGSSRRLVMHDAVLVDSMTLTGTVLGTPSYMAPEQYEGDPFDHRCDQYAFCVTLWEALFGCRPFRGDDPAALQRAKCRAQPYVPTKAKVPLALQRALQRGLAPDPRDRFSSMHALLEQLRRPGVARRRRRLLALGGAFALTVGGGIAVAASPPPEPVVCQGASGRLDGIWDRSTKAAVQAAIEGTGLVYARGTWERLEAVLDDYGAQWVAAHDRICRATLVERVRSEPVMDTSMRCLDDRLGHLEALATTLATADAGVVHRATTAASRLPSVSACEDERLVARLVDAQLREPDDQRAQVEVETIRAQLDQVWARELAGRYADGLELALELHERARAIGFAPIEVQTAVAVGRLRERTGDHDEAAESLRRAYFDARAEGLDGLAAKAATTLTYVVGQHQGRYQEALDVWAKHAAAALERAGDPLVEADLLHVIAVLHRHLGRHEDALAYYRRGLALREQIPGASTASPLIGIGACLVELGRTEEGIEHHRRALAEREESLGPLHPLTAAAHVNLGVAYSRQGDYERALEHQQRALSLWEQALPPGHANITEARYNLAATLVRQSDYSRARSVQLQVLADYEARYGPEHTYTGDALYMLGIVHLRLEDYPHAAEYYARALVVFESALGPEHSHVADALVGIGRAQLRQGQPEAALEPLERALRIFEMTQPTADTMASARFTLAKALTGAGRDPARARQLALTARELYGQAAGEHADVLAELDQWLAAGPG
ncbi:MAG: tetratricopeptide repeat protein [Myxococcota bacterium]